MSEVKLNIIDTHTVLTGATHGSIAERCIAALSAEPETVAELELALARYMKPRDGIGAFASFRSHSEIDSDSYDAGLVIIDLASRVVAFESWYSQPQPEGEVLYHDGVEATDVLVPYCLPPDWLFVNSVEAYQWSDPRRRRQRMERLPLDTRAVLYGPPLLDFIATCGIDRPGLPADDADEATVEAWLLQVSQLHARWLMTPREDLGGRSPRDVLLEKREFIDCDMETRARQWSILGEGPPCLAPDSFAYRFAGFGTHEWVIYYYLVRRLLTFMSDYESPDERASMAHSAESLSQRLKEEMTNWLEQPQSEFDDRVPAVIIENERKRLPQTLSAKELIIDEDCDICRMTALDAEMGIGISFWHLDGYSMDEGFAFSACRTLEEWETENREREEFNRRFDAEWEKRRQCIVDGEASGVDFEWSDSVQRDPVGPDTDVPF